jgi:predicted ATPase
VKCQALRLDLIHRLVTLVDVLYEARTTLYMPAACPPLELFQHVSSAAATVRPSL